MKRVVLASAFMLFIMLSADALASNICDLQTLPSYPSVNSSILLIIPRSAVQNYLANFTHPMKITWLLRDMEYFVLDEGAFIKFRDCWVCEFSGKTSNFYGNCGPTPFRTGGQFMLYFSAKDFERQTEFNRSIVIFSDILTAGVNVDSTGKVLVTVDAPIDTEEVWMTLYSADDGRLMQDYNRTSLREEARPGRYSMDITLLPMGSYYAAFSFRTVTGRAGGGISKFDIKTREVELTAQTDRVSYWIGEEVQISGQTKYDQVSASVRFPNGRVESLGTKTVSSQQFIYTFRLLSSYGEGTYTVTVSAGGSTVQRTFTAQKILDVSPASLSYTVTNRTDTIEKVVTITNTGNDTIALTASTEGLAGHITTSFDRLTLSSADPTATLTVRLSPVSLTASMTGKVLVTGNGVVTVPVDVSIMLDLPGAGPSAGGMKVTPGLWQPQDCLVGKTMSPSLTVQNAGKGEISDFSHTLSSDLTNVVEVTLPSSPIAEGSTASVRLDITPLREKTSGWMEIRSSGGTAIVYINLDCSPELESSIDDLEAEVDSLKTRFRETGFSDSAIDDMFDSLDVKLEDASTRLTSGEYTDANRNYIEARVMYLTLDSVSGHLGSIPVPGGGDGSVVTIVVVIIVVVIIGFLAYIIYSKIMTKGGGSKEGEEEILEEELY